MRKIFLFLALCFAITSFAQKKITCKKGSVKQDGQLIAEYDGVGSMFKLVKLGVFAPGSKDTIIKITEESFDAKNPLWPDIEVAYKIEFKNSLLASFYVRNAKNPGTRFMERDVMEMLFNDTVPALMVQNKLDEPAVEKFRSRYSYDLDKVKKFVKEIEDTIAILNKAEIVRDVTKPVIFKVVNNLSNQYEVNQVSEIYQDGVLLGRMLKKVTPGTFSKATYTFWKTIQPVTVNGIDLKNSPIAYCSTGATEFDIPVIAVVGKTKFEIKGAYNALETQIANLLVRNKLL